MLSRCFSERLSLLKVACIGTGWYPSSPGGLEKYVFGLCHSLAESGNEIDLFVTGPAVSSTPSNLHVRSIALDDEPIWKRWGNARRAFSSAFQPPYDVLNMHFAMTAMPLLPFIDRQIPRVVHFHGPWAAESRAENGNAIATFAKAQIERYVYRNSDRYVVLSTAFKDLLVGYGIDPTRVSVIPMGIDCSLFNLPEDRAGLRTALGFRPDSTVFFTARRLVNRVGVRELIEAAHIVKQSQSSFVLKIAGKGRLHGELQSLIEQLGLGDVVELLGFVPEEDLIRYYQAADATILPTQTLEGFGTIICESLACGTPVIVTPVGGMPEAVEPLAGGLIARSTAPQDIAERMSAAISGALRLPSAAACRSYAVEHYNWDSISNQVKRVFETAR